MPPQCLLNASTMPPQCLLKESSMPPQCLHNASSKSPQCLLNESSMPPQRVLFLLHAHRTFILFSSHVKLRAMYGVCTSFSCVMYSHRIVNWLQIVSAEILRIYLSLYCSLAADSICRNPQDLPFAILFIGCRNP